ncbi:MAG: hypothetical protein AAF958_02900 [Planctomycetota bacterium]
MLEICGHSRLRLLKSLEATGASDTIGMSAWANGGTLVRGGLDLEHTWTMDANETSQPALGDVDLLLINARLRDELEPYRDESIDGSVTRMSLRAENEYLASILAWERAPALPIAQWFHPPLEIPSPDSLGDKELAAELQTVIQRLAGNGVFLQMTDHLSDRDLYRVIYRDILPCCEKRVDLPGKKLRWQCVEDNETYLKFYATAVERRRFQEEYDLPLPRAQKPPFPRQLPA